MKAVTPIPFVRAKFTDKCGKPLVGGKIYTYESNTTTLKDTYKDPYGMVPNTNPIILDTAGEADIYLHGTYRIIVKDRRDSVINDVSKLGSWFNPTLDDALNDISMAFNDTVQPIIDAAEQSFIAIEQNLNNEKNAILQSLQDAIDQALAAGAGSNGWTDKLISTGILDAITQNAFNQKTVTHVNSIAELSTLQKTEGRTVNVKSYNPPVLGERVPFKGGGTFIYIASKSGTNDGISCFNGWTRQFNDFVLTPEMAGATGLGADDDLIAIQKVVNFCLINGDELKKYSIHGSGNYAVSGPVIINNFGYGLNLNFRSITAHSTFPEKTDYKTAKSLIQVGQDGFGGSMTGLKISCDHVNGEGKATWLSIQGYGAGGSTFYAGILNNVVNGVEAIKPKWQAASNTIQGGYWNGGTGHAIQLHKGDGNHVVEGWVIDMTFATGFQAGAILLCDAQYTNIRGQADFNGRYVTKVQTDTLIPKNRDADFVNNSFTGKLIASYEQNKGQYFALVYEGHDTSKDGSKFANGSATCANWSGNITSISVAGTDNKYFDVIHDFIDQPFAKCIIAMPYCGGIEGHLKYTSDITAKNTYDAYGNSINGIGFANSGSAVTLKDTFRDYPLVDYYDKYHAPYSHLNMRGYRIYANESYQTLLQYKATDINTFGKVGDGTVPMVCETAEVTCSSPDGGLGGKWYITVSTTGITINTAFSNNVTLTANGFTAVAQQGAASAIGTVWNIQRGF